VPKIKRGAAVPYLPRLLCLGDLVSGRDIKVGMDSKAVGRYAYYIVPLAWSFWV